MTGMRTILLILTLALPASVLGSAVQTTASQILQATDAFLQRFAEEQKRRGFDVHYETGNLDQRLILAPCPHSLQLAFVGDPWKSQRPSVQVSCAGERPWRLFVTPTVSIRGPGLVSRRALARGEILTADAVTVTTMVLNDSRRGIISAAQEVAGMIARRPISPGIPITPDLLQAPNAVSRGDHVIISARSGAFAVTSRGKALASAAVGEQVLVENLSSSRRIRATVTAPGRVEVPM